MEISANISYKHRGPTKDATSTMTVELYTVLFYHILWIATVLWLYLFCMYAVTDIHLVHSLLLTYLVHSFLLIHLVHS